MGSFEKLVVLTVFFLSAVVLAVSLSTHGDGDGAQVAAAPPGAPAGSERVERVDRALADGAAVPERAGSAPARPAQERAPQSGASAPATDAGSLSGGAPAGPPEKAVEPTVEAAPRSLPTLASTLQGPRSNARDQAAAEGAPTPGTPAPAPVSALVHRRGLEPSPVDGVWLYTWQSSDTWTSVATHFYGAGHHAEALRVANDEAAPAAGRRIFVPEFPGATLAGTGAARPRDARAGLREAPPTPSRPAPSAGGSADASGTDGATFIEHRVEPGETLSSISERYYGTPVRWQRIYDANRDRLSSPNVLRAGQTLRIP
jgi:nucleoid-associated protein YgaU